jgi:ATP synthase protein I
MSEGGPPDPLARLGERIDKARAERVRRQPAAVNDRSALQVGVATGLGWAIDHWLGTRPWGMIVLFFLGVAAGMLNVYRAVARISTPVGYRRPGEDGAGTRGAKDAWDDDEN